MGPDTPQPNSGSFMSSAAGGQNGAGPALLQLMRLRAGNGGALNQNTTNPSMTPPSTPPQGGAMPTPQPTPQPSMGQPMQQPATPEDSLQIAMQALAKYIQAHGEVHMAKNDVPLKKAQASAMSAQNQAPQGGQ